MCMMMGCSACALERAEDERKWNAARDDLRKRLGREPTQQEVDEEYRYRR